MTTADAVERDTHTPAWAVVVLGLLLLPLAALGFALSFQMMLPVMVIAGWSAAIAWGGPVLVDLAAASGALMQMVSRDRGIRWWGGGVLGFSTLLSIFMNLAGHSIERDGHDLPTEYAGMRLGEGWQWVVILMSIATPLFIAVLVHAFGHVLMAYLSGRSGRTAADRESGRPDSLHPTAADSDLTQSAADPTLRPVSTRPNPTPASDPHPTALPTRPDRATESGAGQLPIGPTRPAPDSTADLRESDESGTRPDSDSHPTLDPTADPTSPRVGYPTDPTETRPNPTDRPDSHPTRSADPTPQSTPEPTRPTTRPDSESATDPTDDELTRLVDRARELVESGAIRPTADAIRPALGVGAARAREIRDILKHEQRHGLRAVS